MKALYVTDLHGDENKYRKSLDIAIEEGISVIINGGDMLPKLGERHLEQPIFIKEFLGDYFSELQRHNIHISLCWGMMTCCVWMNCLIRYAVSLEMSII